MIRSLVATAFVRFLLILFLVGPIISDMGGFFKKVFNLKKAFGDNALGLRKVRTKLHLRGKNIQSMFKYFKGYGSTGVAGNSAVTVRGGDVYGPTGSIVGRY